MRNGSIERNFLQEKLRMVGEALQQLKKDRKIRGFLRTGPFSFAKRRMGVDFYAVYIDGLKYIGRPLWITRNGKEIENKKSAVRVSLFESEGSLRTKILEAIKRL